MPIISSTDLGAYLGRPIAAGAQANAATSIIDGLEADLETYLKRPLVPTTVEDEVVKIGEDGKVYLKATPVASVSAFTIDGVAVDVVDYAVERWGFTTWTSVGPTLNLAAPSILASYVGGLSGDDPTSEFGRKAKATLLRAAARDFNQVVREDLAGVSRASVEGTSLDFHGTGGGLTDAEKESFKKWKRRTVRRS